jgi:hypothetical protein
MTRQNIYIYQWLMLGENATHANGILPIDTSGLRL